MEPSTQHGGPPAEQRCKYIFRYYSLSDLNKQTIYQTDANFNSPNNSLMSFNQFRYFLFK